MGGVQKYKNFPIEFIPGGDLIEAYFETFVFPISQLEYLHSFESIVIDINEFRRSEYIKHPFVSSCISMQPLFARVC